MKVALVGASGFVGSRVMEKWTLGGSHSLRLIVRGAGSLARAGRFPLPEWSEADALDVESLSRSIEGCDAMVHAIVADGRQMEAAAETAWRACLKANVPRLVYLSSASVFGQNPAPGTDDLTPLRDDQPSDYNNGKVRAERAIGKAPSELKICVLRPGIVYGPRCQWFIDLPNQLRDGNAILVEGGNGYCNHIYVDNLVRAIELGLTSARVNEGPFYVADDECLTWREFYRPIVESLEYSLADFCDVPAAGPEPKGLRDRVNRFKGGSVSKLVLPRVSRRMKDAMKAALEKYHASPPPGGFALPQPNAPTPDWELSQLHTCRTRIPMDRAKDILEYVPLISAHEGLRRSSEWLSVMHGAPTDSAPRVCP